MEYDGYRVTLKMTFETMMDKVQIDIGVGDVVNPEEMEYQTFDYKGVALFSGALPKDHEIKKAIELTFANRRTALNFPLSFNEEEIKGLQGYWSAHLKKLGVRADGLMLPASIGDIVHELNSWGKNTLK